MKNIRIYLKLNFFIFLYSIGVICCKLASEAMFMSKEFIVLYTVFILILAIYSIAWQQIIKHISLSSAYANKAVNIIWGMLWGVLIFKEKVNLGKIVGALIVIGGVLMYSWSERNTYDS